jgi:Domain of unknown function (DUF4352)
MELQQGDESAHEDSRQQEDEREQVRPPTPAQFQLPGPHVPGWGPYPPAGQGYGQPPYGPGRQQPFPPYGPPLQQWNPGMAFPPYGPPPRGRSNTAQSLLIGFGAFMIAVIVFVAVSVIAHKDQGTRTVASGNSGKVNVNTGSNGSTGSNGNSQSNGNTGAGGNNAPVGVQTAQIGSAITLAGLSTGEQMSVTVTKVYSNAQPIDQYNEAPSGDRLYAIVLQLKNTGSVGYSDAPSNSALVYDSAGNSYQTQFDSVTECQSFQPVVNIAVGSSGVGCVVYEVPNDAKITEVQFILDSGYGPQTGDWQVSG